MVFFKQDKKGFAGVVKETATRVVDKGILKGKYRGRKFATRNIKGSLKKQVGFQKYAQQSFRAPERQGVVIRGPPAAAGLWDYDSNAVPYDSFNQNEMSRRMNRPFSFGLNGMPYTVRKKK